MTLYSQVLDYPQPRGRKVIRTKDLSGRDGAVLRLPLACREADLEEPVEPADD